MVLIGPAALVHVTMEVYCQARVAFQLPRNYAANAPPNRLPRRAVHLKQALCILVLCSLYFFILPRARCDPGSRKLRHSTRRQSSSTSQCAPARTLLHRR